MEISGDNKDTVWLVGQVLIKPPTLSGGRDSYRLIILTSILCSLNAQNTAEMILSKNQGLYIGGYGQIDMNLPISNEDVHYNSKLDVG